MEESLFENSENFSKEVKQEEQPLFLYSVLCVAPLYFLSSKGSGENKMYGFCIKYGDLEEQCSKDEK